MKLREYMNLVAAGAEVTCWDRDIDSEFYFYKKEVGEKPDKDFPNYDKCMEKFCDVLDVVSIQNGGIEVNLYEVLENPKIVEFVKKEYYEEYQYDDDADVSMMLFDDNVTNFSNGYEEFSKLMVRGLDEAFGPEKSVDELSCGSIELEVEKETVECPGEMFYRYLIDDFQIWFTQNQENGNIYSVGVREQGDALKDIEVFVGANEDARGGYYPNEFTLRPRSQAMTVEEAQVYVQNVLKANLVLNHIQEFFETSKHHELFCKYHSEKTVSDLIIAATDKCEAANKNIVNKNLDEFEKE